MNIYQAIMAAADHIEAHPDEFDFCAITSPSGPGCGSPGCALGWIGAFCRELAPRGQRWSFGRVAVRALRLPITKIKDDLGHSAADTFYSRMDAFESEWKYNAGSCASALRQYALTYHADQKKGDIPDDIRALFNQVVEDPDKVPA